MMDSIPGLFTTHHIIQLFHSILWSQWTRLRESYHFSYIWKDHLSVTLIDCVPFSCRLIGKQNLRQCKIEEYFMQSGVTIFSKWPAFPLAAAFKKQQGWRNISRWICRRSLVKHPEEAVMKFRIDTVWTNGFALYSVVKEWHCSIERFVIPATGFQRSS